MSFGYAGEVVPGASPEAVIDHFDDLHASLVSLLREAAAYRVGLAIRLNPAKYQS